MNLAFILTIDSDVVDPVGLQNLAEDLHSALESHFDVVDVKPWARPTLNMPTQQQTGAPPLAVP